MFDSTFVSCPVIGFNHHLEAIATTSTSPQWDILFPTTHYTLLQLVDDLDKAHEIFLEETKAAFEASYDEYLDADLITISSTPVFEMADDEDLLDEPACGDCGGCCECLGDPPDCRWDTTAERDEELNG